jgi:hypothetical protein
MRMVVVLPEEAHEGAFGYDEVDVIEGRVGAEALDQTFHDDPARPHSC